MYVPTFKTFIVSGAHKIAITRHIHVHSTREDYEHWLYKYFTKLNILRYAQ